ncbi:MAG: hypothetical protein Q8K78_12600 [Planctomycetaceae bacterium]|nr:hypothetical protein [Planctomycetaceae bacterium]
MAIEFRCPYCTATIRVADSAPGRVGKCPKCNTKMIVPKPSAALPPTISFGLGEPPASPPSMVPDDEPVLLEENDANVPDVHFASTDAPVEPIPTTLPTNLVPVIAPVGRRVVKKRKTGRKRPQVMWLIATVLGLGLSVGAAYVVWLQVFNGRLDGELIGTALEKPQLPAVAIPRASLGLVASALDPALSDLEAQPVPLVSELMDVRIGGSKDGLMIHIEQGARTHWYRVDAKSHPGLAKFANEHEKVLEAPRTKQLAQAAPGFIRDYLKVRKKEESASALTVYRDSLALNALVKGLGAHTVAVVGRTIYPCVYEQADGSLYFLLPAKLKSFTLQGKPNPDGSRGLFTGEFRVVVKPDQSPPKEPISGETPSEKTLPDDSAMKETSEESTDDKPTDTTPKKTKKKSAKKR